jgi:16S rRNA (uracil1498-N3)-methyltransferase
MNYPTKKILHEHISSIGIIVGPEGGFTTEEFRSLTALKNTTCLRLAPFVLRADTAAIAGAAVVQNLIERQM